MKILIIFLIFVMCIGTFFLTNSNAQAPPTPREDPSLPEISLQLQVRNSEGILVNYLEPSIFFLRNIDLIHEMLDAEENKTPIIIDGKNYEQIEFERISHYTTSGDQIAGWQVGWEGFGVLLARHNGYITESGDIITASWKIIRTVQ